jgi:hypothetical protein
MQGWLNICKSINVIKHINRIKDKNHMTTSNRCRKSLEKSNHFIIKPLKKLGVEVMYPNMIMAI